MTVIPVVINIIPAAVVDAVAGHIQLRDPGEDALRQGFELFHTREGELTVADAPPVFIRNFDGVEGAAVDHGPGLLQEVFGNRETIAFELPEGAENGERPGGQEPTFDADGNIVLPEDFDGELDENGAPVRPEGEQGNFGPMNGMAPEMNGELPALPEGMEPGERPEDGAENGGFPGMPGGEQGFGGMQGGQSFGDEQGFGGMQGGQSFDGPQSFGGSQGGPDLGGFGGRR